MPYLSEMRAFTSELPRGWLPCEGQELEIQRHQALFSLIGFNYGGNDRTVFALPDLRGRVTAGADPRRKQKPGDTSGHTGDHDAAIPYRVERWAIAVSIGEYPTR
jgi:microcystin-dependent protein